MIISTAYYGWGTKDTVSHVTSFLGVTVTCRTHDDFFQKVTLDRVQSFHNFLASHQCEIMVWDNFQQGKMLREQRGGQWTKFLIGTVEAIHHVVLFLNFQFNDRNVLMMYDRYQLRLSTLGMRAYEYLDPSLATYRTELFLNHKQLYVPESACFVGAHVCQYDDAISLWKIICNRSHPFTCIYKGNLSVMNVDNIACMNEC